MAGLPTGDATASLFGEAMASIDARLEELLSSQRRLERTMSELLAGQPASKPAEESPKRQQELPSARLSHQPKLARVGSTSSQAGASSPSCTDVQGMASSAGHVSSMESTAHSAVPFWVVQSEDLEFEDIDDESVEACFDWLAGVGHRRASGEECQDVGHTLSLLAGEPETLDAGARLLLDPHGKVRATHDFISILVLAIDVVSAPVILAWNLDVSGSLRMFNVCSFIFWSLDIFMSFGTSFYVQGELEARPHVIAKKYMKSWFLPDFSIVLADLITFALNGSGGSSTEAASGAARLTKISRLLRLVRLLRLARVYEAFTRLSEISVYFELAVETVKPLFAILLVNHTLACAWWSISSYLPSDTGLRWINEQVSSSVADTYAEAAWSYQYFTCLHWSLTQQTPGSMQVVPLNSIERAFNCFCLLLGMLLFSSLISLISAKIMQHYSKQKNNLAKLAALRRFLMNKVEPAVTFMAHQQAKKAMLNGDGRPVTVKEVAAISLLPQAMQRKVIVELCSRHLYHPLLRWWFIVDPQSSQAFCHSAIEFVGIATENHVFFPYTKAGGAYIMTSGLATYIPDKKFKMGEKTVCQGDFFCEAALWCQWKHAGELIASRPCELMFIDAIRFFACLDTHPVVKHVVTQYAKAFCRCLTSPLFPPLEPPDDLYVAFADFPCLLPSLPMSCRQLIGVAALRVRMQNSRHGAISSSLLAEVRGGRCCLMVDAGGEVERIMVEVALRLEREDGRVLMQLGVWDGDRVEACLKLPGRRQEDGEQYAHTMERLVSSLLAPLAITMTHTQADLEETLKICRETAMTTRHLRLVSHAELEVQGNWPTPCATPRFSQALRELGTSSATHAKKSRRSSLVAVFSRGFSFNGFSNQSSKTSSEPQWKSRCSKQSRSSARYSVSASQGFATRSQGLATRSRDSQLTAISSRGVQDISEAINLYTCAEESGEVSLVAWLSPEQVQAIHSAQGERWLQDALHNVEFKPRQVEFEIDA